MQAIYLLSLITLHGFPYATTLLGISLTTKDPAPIMVLLPICIPSIIFAPMKFNFSPLKVGMLSF